jgi:hypothetical protein
MPVPFEVRKSNAEQGFAKNAQRLGVNGDFIGTQFTAYGTVWTVMGLNRRIRKLPVLAYDAKNRVREFTLEYVNTNKVV